MSSGYTVKAVDIFMFTNKHDNIPIHFSCTVSASLSNFLIFCRLWFNLTEPKTFLQENQRSTSRAYVKDCLNILSHSNLLIYL